MGAGNTSIDIEKLEQAIKWFAKYVAIKQKGKNVDFYSGFMEVNEGYKRVLFANGHSALNNFYKGNDDKTAFEDACEFFGRWFPTFSYLMFLKDSTRYLPVMSSDKNHGDRFKKLNISRECLSYCSWDNYQVFLDIHKQIQEKLIEAFPENQVSLLDAHSFVWMLYAAPDDFSFKLEDELENIPGATDFVDAVASQINYKEKAKQENAETEKQIIDFGIKGEEREAIIKTRVNQGAFRKRLLLRYKRCCLCGVSDTRLLKASHIKPWRWSDTSVLSRSSGTDIVNRLQVILVVTCSFIL